VNPTSRWTTIAGSFRFFGGYAIGFFMPLYFGGVYEDYDTEYSVINSVVVSLFGFLSALFGGMVSDHFYKKGEYMSKAYVCMFCSMMGIPMIAVCLLF